MQAEARWESPAATPSRHLALPAVDVPNESASVLGNAAGPLSNGFSVAFCLRIYPEG